MNISIYTDLILIIDLIMMKMVVLDIMTMGQKVCRTNFTQFNLFYVNVL